MSSKNGSNGKGATALAGAPPKYPWDKWLNGQTWILVRGKDYQCKNQALVVLAHRSAKIRSKHVSVVVLDKSRVYLRAKESFSPVGYTEREKIKARFPAPAKRQIKRKQHR